MRHAFACKLIERAHQRDRIGRGERAVDLALGFEAASIGTIGLVTPQETIYGALTTPDLFVFDSELRLRYRGAPDADHQDPAQNAAWLRSALDAVLSGSEPEPAETEPVGCSIKWKQ